MIKLMLCCSVLLAFAACENKSTPTATKLAGDTKKNKPEKKHKSNIKRLKTAVPYGKKVACEKLFDMNQFAEHAQLDIGEMKDKSNTHPSACSVCSFIRGGKAPTAGAQQAQWEKNNRKLGVLPGDEYCSVTALCSFSTNPEEFKEKCEKSGDESTQALGPFACVHKSDRPPHDWAYTYKVIDPDTKCVYEVRGGPSVTDEQLVQRCTKAALDLITLERLGNTPNS